MKGTVAIHLESESCDSYLHLFKDKSIEEIRQFLYSEMEMFSPLSDYTVVSDDKSFESKICALMQEILTKSWEE